MCFIHVTYAFRGTLHSETAVNVGIWLSPSIRTVVIDSNPISDIEKNLLICLINYRGKLKHTRHKNTETI